MAKPSRWNAEKRYQIVKEALGQKEPMGQIADGIRSLKGCSIGGGETFLRGGVRRLWPRHAEEAGLGRQVKDLQKLIREQAIEIRFFKTAVEEPRPRKGSGSRRTIGQTGDKAIGIIENELLPADLQDER